MADLMSPTVVNGMIRATPGWVAVAYGGVTGYGHDAHVPTGFEEPGGVVGSRPSVVVADGYFPGIGLDTGAGTAAGVNEDVQVGEYIWTIREIEPGEAPGEIRLMLSNRRSP